MLDDDPTVVLACPRPDPVDGAGNPTTGVIRPGPGQPEHDYRAYTNQDGPWSADDPDPVVRWHRLMRDIWYTVQLYGLIRSDAWPARACTPTTGWATTSCWRSWCSTAASGTSTSRCSCVGSTTSS